MNRLWQCGVAARVLATFTSVKRTPRFAPSAVAAAAADRCAVLVLGITRNTYDPSTHGEPRYPSAGHSPNRPRYVNISTG
jgi:hypothetical protein